MYQKEIIYMGLHKNGSRVGSAGFLKAEKKDKTSALTMVVKNIPHSIEGRFPVRYCLGTACSGQISETGGADDRGQMAETGSTDAGGQTDRMNWKEEDGITLRDGGGVWEKRELEDAEWIHVQILLPNGYLVEGESKAAMKQAPPKAETQPVEPTVSTPREFAFAQRDAAAEPIVGTPRESAVAQKDAAVEPSASALHESASVIAAPQRDVSGVEPIVSASQEPVIAVPQRDVPTAEQTVSVSAQPIMPGRPPLMADALAIEGLKENKWEQILDTYDRIHPYGDSRVYVKLAPKDFIILSSSCQHLVNNSFLLHGFYNYRYVILGKNENSFEESSSEGYDASARTTEDYLLGVPGVFYEREKMVALMFGFEAFECEGGDPKPGDFGYYLRKVTL